MASSLDLDGLRDIYTKTGEAYIVARAGGDEADRVHIEVTQDLCAEAYIAPHLLADRGTACLLGAHFLACRHARGALAQIDQHAAALALEDVIDRVEHMRRAEDIGDDVLAMQ